MLSDIYRKLSALWFKGNAVRCNCCSLKFRSFVCISGEGDHSCFLCPSCRSTAEDRLLRYFLQSDTSFYASGSKNLLYTRRNQFIAQGMLQCVDFREADFIVCNDLDLCPQDVIRGFLPEAKAGACFVFASQYADPLVMEKHLAYLFPAMEPVMVNFNKDIETKDRAYWGLVSDMPIFVVRKAWRSRS